MQEKFDKPDDYYKAIRSVLLRLIPQDADIKRVLDIGCGAGGNASILRMMGVEYIAGVEINPDIAELAKKVMDCVIVASIEDTGKLSFKTESFDLIICGDVLEHLVNPL